MDEFGAVKSLIKKFIANRPPQDRKACYEVSELLFFLQGRLSRKVRNAMYLHLNEHHLFNTIKEFIQYPASSIQYQGDAMMIAQTLRHTLPLMLLFPLLLFSQQPNTVTIFGTVSDRASGAGLAGVRVEVISEADSSDRAAAISDSSGAYRATLSLSAARAGEAPQDFALMQNYPNPFNPTTLIQFQIAQASPVRLDIYNILGQKVRSLVNEQLPAGRYTAVWDGRSEAGTGLAAGIYFYRLQAGGDAKARKMVLMDGGAAAPAVSAPLNSGFGKDAFAETGDAQIRIRLTSPFIKYLKKRHVKVSAASFRYDLSAEVRRGILNRELIIVSEPGKNGLVYISGRAGAVLTDMNGAMEVVVVNRRADEKKVKMPVNLNGSIPLMRLGARVGDRLTLTLQQDGKTIGIPEEFIVPEALGPFVIDSKPTNGDKDIVLDVIITITFSEPVDPATVDANSFYLADNLGNRVPAAIDLNHDFTVASLDPADSLSYDTEYAITVTSAVADLQGLHMESAYEATFKTVAAPPAILNGWVWQNSGTIATLEDVFFTDANIGIAVGRVGQNGIILRTADGGATWHSKYNGAIEWFCGVFFSDANTGTVVGALGAILRTTDGGESWMNQASGTSRYLFDVTFIDANTGWAAGDEGTILHTTNGGINWISLNSGTTDQFQGISFGDTNTGIAVGYSHTMSRTTDGGVTWNVQNTGVSGWLQDIYFSNSNTCTMVGNDNDGTSPLGIIFRTTDGGENWISQNTPRPLRDVFFSDLNTGWVVGMDGQILHTTDGGDTWISQDSGTATHLSSVFFIDANTGWVVGEDGAILHTTSGGRVSTQQPRISPAPGMFELRRNYPGVR